jgi:hypothetical protein
VTAYEAILTPICSEIGRQGIKDSAHRVFDALHDSSSELGEKIRGKARQA